MRLVIVDGLASQDARARITKCSTSSARRWSPRAFDPATDVSQAELLPSLRSGALGAVRRATSSRGDSSRRRAHRSPEAFAALLSSLKAKNRAWAEAAPVLVLVAVQNPPDVERRGERPRERVVRRRTSGGIPDAAGHRDGAVHPADGRLRRRARPRGVRRARRVRAGRRHGDRLRGRSGHACRSSRIARPSASRGRASRSPTSCSTESGTRRFS